MNEPMSSNKLEKHEAGQKKLCASPEVLPVKTVTPMMVQYLSIKRENPEGLLFYRMGDFYELFFEDAIIAAAALNITLTKRGKHLGEDISMCGVPVNSHENYLSRLIKQGHKVAVCEQIENPAEAKKRGAKSVVRREVVRTITRGTLTEDTLLDSKRNNFLLALAEAQGHYGLAWLDMSTGDFQMQPLSKNTFTSALARLDPGEVLISDKMAERADLADLFKPWRENLSVLPASKFDSANGDLRLQELFGVKTLDAFGLFSRAELAAGGVLIDYIELTQQGQLPRIAPPKRLSEGAVMEIDAASRRNLELIQNLSGERKGSLLSIIDQTLTGAGGRLLASHISAPLTDVVEINKRLDMVQYFYDDHNLWAVFCDFLRQVPDIERALSRLTLSRGGPRDLAIIRDGLALTSEISTCLQGPYLPAGIQGALDDFGGHENLVLILDKALEPVLPSHARDGGFIAEGFASPFDELRSLRDQSRRLIVGLQDDYVQVAGVRNLKIKHNNVLGYFIEVSARNAEGMPAGPEDIFIHRQTMKNVVRYTTVELGELEGKIASAADKALAMEFELYDALVAKVAAQAEEIALAASALACLDVAAALAGLAVDQCYCRPFVDGSLTFDIKGGRHPVVEWALTKEDIFDGSGSVSASFVSNDCCLSSPSQLWLLTGPNMAGKSTFLRQNALITILAQMGAFVPAERVHLGVVDRLFSRVGAADDLARGRSTFMVEMVETAAILSQATDRSFVILDEIGRGTATFDGLSIAWAVVEHLHEVNKSRALFATHYHELTNLSTKLVGLTCHTLRVKEWKGRVVFLHEVASGAANRSYGIHVGQLAGLPAGVVARAEEVLAALEEGNQGGAITRLADDLPLFASSPQNGHGTSPEISALELELDTVLADELSPKEALDLIYKLKKLR